MRQQSGQPEGVHIAQVFADIINDKGELLQITPGPAHPGRQTGVRQLIAIVEAPPVELVRKLKMEGSFNVDDAAPYIFTFPGGSDVMANDSTVFEGWKYVFLDAYPQPYNGGVVGIRCLGVRRGTGAGVGASTSAAMGAASSSSYASVGAGQQPERV